MRSIRKILILGIFLLLLFGSGCLQPRACTMDAKLCPDGSAVGRVPPDCEFAPCPNIANASG